MARMAELAAERRELAQADAEAELDFEEYCKAQAKERCGDHESETDSKRA
jgi:hypothetical protein